MKVFAVFEGTVVTGPAKNLLQFAQAARPEVDLELAVFYRTGQNTAFVEAAEAAGVRVHRIPEKGRFDRSVLTGLRDWIRQGRPDIVQSHMVKSHFLFRYAGLPRLAPWVAFQHGYTTTDWVNRAYNYADHWSMRAAHHVIAVSGALRDEFVARGIAPARVSVVHNAIRPDWGSQARQPEQASALRRQLGLGPETPVILIAARLSLEKDHQLLVRVVAGLRPTLRPHLIIAGDGPERAALEQTIERLQLKDQVTMTGWVATAEPYYGIADVAVLCSRSEGSPNALLEAIGAGVTVVATSVGGIPEIVRHQESAWLVPSGDEAALGEGLRAVLTDRTMARQLGEAGQASARSRFSPAARAAAITAVYRKLLS